MRRAGKTCQTVPGKIVDAAVAALLIEMMTPMTLAVTLILLVGPAWLFFDPTNPIPRDAVQVYRLYSDDYAYLGFSRTFDRTRQNLFVGDNAACDPTAS